MKASRKTVQRVWSAISRAPQASTRALANHLHIAPSSAHVALTILRDAGYIEYQRDSQRARRIIIPFVELEELALEQEATSALAAR
jgi:DNA-binding MarR family transcriptional regulator